MITRRDRPPASFSRRASVNACADDIKASPTTPADAPPWPPSSFARKRGNHGEQALPNTASAFDNTWHTIHNPKESAM